MQLENNWQLDNGWIYGVKRVVSPHCDQRPEGEAPSLLVIHNISLPPVSLAARI